MQEKQEECEIMHLLPIFFSYNMCELWAIFSNFATIKGQKADIVVNGRLAGLAASKKLSTD